jgi:hypothetical protein
MGNYTEPVSYPPTGRRRRRLVRTLAFAAIGLLVVLAGGGFVYWQKTRFPARSAPLAGTPIVLRVQDGVNRRELRAIRIGLRAASRFMAAQLRRPVHGPVEGRVAHKNSCRPFQAAGGALMGQGERGFLCIDTRSLSWRYLVRTDSVAASSVAAHEYVHVLQGEIGCLPAPRGQHYRWLIEGMATEVAWRALERARRATEAGVKRAIRADGPLDPGLYPLWRYEREDGRDHEYALWHVAVRSLMRDVARARAAPRARPELSLLRFCRRVATGEPWRLAFARSFGVSLERFYARFEAARRRGDALLR